MTKRRLGGCDVHERRVHKHDVERSRRPRIEECDDIGRNDSPAFRETGRVEVAPECLECLGAPLNERRGSRAAREGFDAEGARAGEQVKDLRVGEIRFEDREERLANPVGRRSRTATPRHDQRPSLRFPSDDPHQASA